MFYEKHKDVFIYKTFYEIQLLLQKLQKLQKC